MASSSEGLKVYVRVRPPIYQEVNETTAVYSGGNHVTLHTDKYAHMIMSFQKLQRSLKSLNMCNHIWTMSSMELMLVYSHVDKRLLASLIL